MAFVDIKAQDLRNIELSKRYIAGDEEAFSELFKENAPLFIGRLIKKGIRLHDAQDIVQIVFTKVYKNIKAISEKKINHWMGKVLKNEYVNLIRHYKTKIQSNKINLESFEEEVMRAAVEYDDPSKLLEVKEPNERLLIIKEAISLLRDRERRILELSLEDREYKDIAKELNIPHGTVMSRVFYARKALKRKCKTLMDSRKQPSIN
mgnify:FL=1